MLSPRNRFILLLTILLTTCLSLSTLAQSDQGRIAGTVKDQTGAVIPNATILVKNERTGDERTANSNADGYYTITALRPSLYTIKFSSSNFANYEVKSAQVLVGQTLVLEAEMKPVGATDTINIISN